MKHIILPLCLAAAITGRAQTYGAGVMGMAFGKTWNGKQEIIGPQSPFFAMPITYIHQHLIIEGQGLYSVAPVLSGSIGLKTGHFELLAGAGDEVGASLHPLQITHYFAPLTTARLVFGHFTISTQYFNGSLFLGLGLRAGVNE